MDIRGKALYRFYAWFEPELDININNMKRFNVRVYGIWIDNGRLLVSEEIFNGNLVTKLPGGGMEWGEGTIECLKREWKEEMGIDIDVTSHFYTTDYFIKSWVDNSQLISIYYLVQAPIPANIHNYVPGERTYWIDIKTLTAETFTLPIDKIVSGLIEKAYGK
jgi:8-oxo-dGTP diphosphatase